MDPFTEKLLQKAEQRSRNLGISTATNSSVIDFHKKQIVESTINKLNVVERKLDDKRNTENPALIKRHFSVDKENMDLGIEINITTKPNVDVRVEVEEEEVETYNKGVVSDNGRTKITSSHTNIEDMSSSKLNNKKFTESCTENDSKLSKGGQKFRKLAALADSINSWENETSREHKLPLKNIQLPSHTKETTKPKYISTNISGQLMQAKDKQVTKSNVAVETNPTRSTKILNWDKNVMNCLEAQGFQRKESSPTKYSYQYEDNKKKLDNSKYLKKAGNSQDFKNIPEHKNFEIGLVSAKSRVFGNKALESQKDPAEMSLKERMQLFEKNKGEALIPKAAFGMAIPAKKIHYETKQNTENKCIPQCSKNKISEKINLYDTKQIPDISKQNEVLKKVAQIYQNVQELDNEITIPQIVEKSSNSKGLHKRRSPSSVTKDEKNCIDDKSSDEKRAKTVSNRLYPILTDFEDTDSEINNCTTATVTTDEKHEEEEWSLNSTDSDDDTNVCEDKIMERDASNDSKFIKNKEVRYASQATYFGDDTSTNTYDSTDIEREIMQDSDSDLSSDNFSFESKERKETDKSDSFCYKKQIMNTENATSSKNFNSGSPVKSELSVRKSVDKNMVTLVHTVSFYRKQKSNTATPIRSICREQLAHTNLDNETHDLSSDDDTDSEKDEDNVVKEKIKKLLDEVCKEQQIIGQTSQALNLCAATIEFAGSTESVEGERHLLVATHRRQSALDEIQRLRVDRSLRPPGTSKEMGRITIDEITLPLRHDYIRKLSANAISGHHLVCLIKYNENVLSTKTVPTLPGLLAVKFPNVLKLNNIYADFRVSVEVYGMTAQREILPHEVKYHINVNKKTPQKKQNDSKLFMPLIQSPAGPNVVRTPALVQYGFAIFSLREIKRNTWTLNQFAEDCPLDGVIKMKLNCELSITIEHKGFLTMFEDMSGFGAWHRRWCYLNGHILNYWKYPDDEKKKAPIGSIDLYTCRSSKVAIAPRDICARLNTMLLENHRPPREDDVESLLIVPKGEITVVRTLLSADTKEERNEWCAYLNKALTLIRTWDPPKQ